MRDMELWSRDAEDLLEPILRKSLGDEHADAKILYLHMGRSVAANEARLQEFGEALETMPREVGEERAADPLLKEKMEGILDRLNKLRPLYSSSNRAMPELAS